MLKKAMLVSSVIAIALILAGVILWNMTIARIGVISVMFPSILIFVNSFYERKKKRNSDDVDGL